MQLKTVTTNLGLEGMNNCSLVGYMLEGPSIILRLSCLLHVFVQRVCTLVLFIIIITIIIVVIFIILLLILLLYILYRHSVHVYA